MNFVGLLVAVFCLSFCRHGSHSSGPPEVVNQRDFDLAQEEAYQDIKSEADSLGLTAESLRLESESLLPLIENRTWMEGVKHAIEPEGQVNQPLTINADLNNSKTIEDAQARYVDLKSQWDKLYDSNTVDAWMAKAEILTEVDHIVEAYGSRNLLLKPFAFTRYPSYLVYTDKPDSIPLISSLDISSALNLPQDQITDDKVLGALRSRGLLLSENSSVAAIMRRMYSNRNSMDPAKLLSSQVALRTITNYEGYQYRRPLNPASSLRDIAKFSASLGIQPYEMVPSPEGFVFRGPGYLFGKSFRDYTTLNDWFVRDLSPKARRAYLTSPSAVVSVADARLRLKKLHKGKLNTPQALVGKVLNDDAVKLASKNQDDPLYYTSRYAFRVSELMALDLKVQPVEPSQEASKENILKAQRITLHALYDYMNQQEWIQVIHRLAPQDIHNYVAPADARSLRLPELAKFLFTADDNPLTGALTTRVTPGVLRVLEAQESTLGRPAKTTIDIWGRNASVSTMAVKSQPNILAQNDRKLLVLEHRGSTGAHPILSVHFFIGATGVNRVNVNTQVKSWTQAEQMGDMGFGPDLYESSQFKTRDTTTLDGLPKLKNVAQGDPIYHETLGGSTVLSFYPARDYRLTEELEGYLQKFGNLSEIPEILVKMGYPICNKI